VRIRSESAPTSGFSKALRMPCAIIAAATHSAGTARCAT
jgi:hypothetical protein